MSAGSLSLAPERKRSYSVCHQLAKMDVPPSTLKAFRPERRHNSPESVRSEFDALGTFAAALKGPREPLGCPRPVALAPEEGLAYLMTYVGGEALGEYLVRTQRRWREVLPDIAAAVVDGLERFYEAVEPAMRTSSRATSASWTQARHGGSILLSGDGGVRRFRRRSVLPR